MMTLYKDLFDEGQVDIGFVRTDQMNRTGYGKIGSVIIVMDDDISKREIPFVLTVERTYAIDNSNTEIPTIGRGGSTGILVDNTSTAIASIDKKTVRVYPNPLSIGNSLQIESLDATLKGLRLIDQTGRVLYQTQIPGGPNQYQLELEQPSPGIYFLEINTNKGSIWERIVIRQRILFSF